MQADDTHIKWIPGDINNEFWYDQITEALHHCEWVTKWEASWIDEPTDWRIGIHNEENFLCWVLPIEVDQDVIDALLQGICFGELVYG